MDAKEINIRKRPTQKRSKETYHYILKGAAKVIEDNGLSGFNTNKIAEVSGVSIGSIYQYFSTKESILVELIESYFKSQDDFVIDKLNSIDLEKISLHEALYELIDTLFDRLEEQPQISRELLSQAENLNVKNKIEALDKRIINHIYRYLNQTGRIKGLTKSKVKLAMSAFKGMNDFYFRNPGAFSGKKYRNKVVAVIEAIFEE